VFGLTIAAAVTAPAVAAPVDDPALPPDVRAVSFDPLAVAYAPTRTESGTPIHWESGCVFLRPHPAGALDVPSIAEPLRRAADGWEGATAGCSYLRFLIEPPEAGEVRYDRVNRIIVREDRWCRPGPPERCYDHSSVANTTVYFLERPGDPTDGVIVDADLELNAVDFALANCDAATGDCTTAGTGERHDLQNVLTHELGHVIGLNHLCWSNTPATAPYDSEGNTIPQCNTVLPPEITLATMFNFADPEELIKRTPEADDVDGVCTRYPAAADPGTCERVGAPAGVPDADPGGGDDTGGDDAGAGDAGCCGAAGAPTPSIVLALALAALARRGRSSSRLRHVGASGRSRS
jgi:hypothetical protein